MALFLVIVVGLGWFISFYYQSPIILIIAVILSVVMNITGYWFSDKIFVLPEIIEKSKTKAKTNTGCWSRDRRSGILVSENL